MSWKYKLQALSNGIRLITVPMPGTASVTALCLVGVGSRFETKKTNGLSHFFEHMVFKGTKKYPNHLVLSSVVDSIGAEFNGFTDKEFTGYYVKSSAKHLSLALDVLSQMVFRPILKAEEIKKEKGVILEEINMINDQPLSKVGEDFEVLLYGKTPLGWEVIGKKENIKKMEREDFLKFHQRWYRPERIVVAIAGAIAKIENRKLKIEKIVEEYFSHSRGCKGFQPRRLKFVQGKPAVTLRFKKTEQAHFCLGTRAFKRRHKDRYALALLTTILGGNMSSRLFVEVRAKRGLAYYVRSSAESFIDNGYFVTQAGVDVNKIKEAMKVILGEYEKVKSSKSRLRRGFGGQAKVKSQELKRAKEYLKGGIALALENSREVASWYANDLLLEGKLRTPEQVIKKIEQVSLEDISRVAREIFTQKNLNLAIIGPYRDISRFEGLMI